MRQHIVSLSAVFLALAVGVVVGTTGVSDRLLSAATGRSEELSAQVEHLTAERDGLAAAVRADDAFVRSVGPDAVAGTLSGRSVTLVTAGADPADRDALAELITAAGGRVAGEVALTAAVGDPGRADQLRELTAQLLPAGAELPAAADTGSLLGGLLGSVLLVGADNESGDGSGGTDTAAVLPGLAGAGFVGPGAAPEPADLVLVLTGGALPGADAGEVAAVLARTAAQLDRSGAGAVLAGRTGTAGATGAVGVARADPAVTEGLSTVDDVQSARGRVSAVLALGEQLAGRAGRYGIDVTAADGAAPAA